MKFLTYLIAFELLAGIALADDRYSIDLRGGGRVVGTLLTEKPDALFVDLGHDVVRLPKDQILKRQGRMVSAIQSIGRGADAFEGTPFHLPLAD